MPLVPVVGAVYPCYPALVYSNMHSPQICQNQHICNLFLHLQHIY